jgi:hypothetical protein
MAGSSIEDGKALFNALLAKMREQEAIIKRLAEKIQLIDHIGGGGSGSIEDYVSGKQYNRNTLLVDPLTETLYRVKPDTYTSITVDADLRAGNLKLVGFESQIVTFNHLPTQAEIDALPKDVLVAIYSTTDTPYEPILSSDNVNNP